MGDEDLDEDDRGVGMDRGISWGTKEERRRPPLVSKVMSCSDDYTSRISTSLQDQPLVSMLGGIDVTITPTGFLFHPFSFII